MKVFVVNCGSSSIKYQLFDMTDESVLAKGLLERVGSPDSNLSHTAKGITTKMSVKAPDHHVGLKAILNVLVDPKIGVIGNVSEINGIGHRVLHGGEVINQTCLIDDRVRQVIRDHFQLGPLHNPANLMGIDAAIEAMPQVPNVAVFDTSFFTTLPPHAYRYALPGEWYTKYHVRRYGFHGTSHRFVTRHTAGLLGKKLPDLNIITTHLGNGCSMTAVAGGKAVDHSMGLTPLEGLVMGTRCGDMDPAILFYMAKVAGLSTDQLDDALNKKSGLLGVSGVSNDMRDCLAASEGGNANAALAVDLFVYRVVKYVGSYFTILPSCDAVVLTGGVGENSTVVRKRIVQGLARLGAVYDDQRNNETIRGKTGPITSDGCRLPVWVVPTNEELMIAQDTMELVSGNGKANGK